MRIFEGKIWGYDKESNEELSYEIKQLTAVFEEDRPNMIGIVRCVKITIESDAPADINSAAENEFYNKFAAAEYSDGNEEYKETAKKAISEQTGLDISQIEIV